MAKVFTDTEKDKIKKQAQYILAAMDDIGNNGDAYCTDELLFSASKTVKPSLTGPQYHTDKSLLLQAEFLHQEGRHLYTQRTWDYEITAAKRLADILKDPTLPAPVIPKELRVGDILLSKQQREAVELALNSRLSVILGGAGSGKTTLIEAIVNCFEDNTDLSGDTVLAAPTGKAARNLTERTGIEARTVHGALGKARMQTFWTPFRGTASDWSSSMRRRWCPWRCSPASSTVSAGIAALFCSATRISCCPSGQETSFPTF